MEREEQWEIERLLCDVIEDKQDTTAIEKLNDLLLDRPDLQAYYSHFMETHLLLDGELAGDFERYSPLASAELKLSSVAEQTSCSELVERIDTDLQNEGSKSQSHRWAIAALATLAASLLAVLIYRDMPAGGTAPNVATTADASRWHQDMNQALYWTADDQAVSMVSHLTRTTSPRRLLLPSLRAEDLGLPVLVEGTAWLEYASGFRERSRVIALPPGKMMEMYVDTDASSQNNLSIVELDSIGHAVGSSYSVSNVADERDEANLRSGWIGNIALSNPTKVTKYFLLTGAYLTEHDDESKVWAPSDFRVYVDTPEVLIIGWDDQSYSGQGGLATKHTFAMDNDYNDIRAIVRFSPLDGKKVNSSLSTYMPEPPQPEKQADRLGIGYEFDLRPGEEVYLMASSYAAYQNAVQIVDSQTRQIVWQHEGLAATDDLSNQFPADRGVFVIRNQSNVIKRYELQSRCFYKNRGIGWKYSPYRLLGDNPDTALVGFEDSPQFSKSPDWDDILVAIYWFDRK